jgi:hypothetical protein
VPDLEQKLTALAADIEWPSTPRLHVAIPLPARRPGARRATSWLGRKEWQLPIWLSPRVSRPLAVAAAALLIVAIALAAYPPSRDAIARWVNLHTTIQRVHNPPTPSPLPSGSTGERLHLGTPTTLEAAQQKVTWKIAVPSTLGPPDEVYLKEPPSGPSQSEVALVYVKRAGMPESRLTGVSVLVMEARGKFNEIFFQKTIGSGGTIEEVNVGGHVGYWITGEPHDFFFTDADGQRYFDTLRLAGNTLLFDDDGTLVRIEGDMTREQAIQLGASL